MAAKLYMHTQQYYDQVIQKKNILNLVLCVKSGYEHNRETFLCVNKNKVVYNFGMASKFTFKFRHGFVG